MSRIRDRIRDHIMDAPGSASSLTPSAKQGRTEAKQGRPEAIAPRAEDAKIEVMRERVAASIVVLGFGLCVAAGVGCRQYPPPVPLNQLNAEQTAGHEVYEAQCAQCHSDREDRARNGPSLRSIFKKPALHSGAAATDERVTATVLHGHGMMPALGDRVDEQQMAELLAYLHTL